MKEQILESLELRFKYEPRICKQFLEILNIRYGKTSPFYLLFNNFLESKDVRNFFENPKQEFITELKHLNMMNLKARLEYLEENKIPETVVIAYLKLLKEEMAHPSLCAPSIELIQGEEKMIDYLFEKAEFNEDRTEFLGISNTNFRLVLQTWVLYPEFLKNKDKCSELLECLSLTPFEF